MIKENGNVKQKLDDMIVTAQQNKDLLKEYINNITTKDQIVDKLQCTIENLQERINNQEDYIKKAISKNKNTSPDTNIRNNHFQLTNRNNNKEQNDEAIYSMTQRANSTIISFNDIKEVNYLID